jgi:hypothetical protein
MIFQHLLLIGFSGIMSPIFLTNSLKCMIHFEIGVVNSQTEALRTGIGVANSFPVASSFKYLIINPKR